METGEQIGVRPRLMSKDDKRLLQNYIGNISITNNYLMLRLTGIEQSSVPVALDNQKNLLATTVLVSVVLWVTTIL